jgi:hypothetical protein
MKRLDLEHFGKPSEITILIIDGEHKNSLFLPVYGQLITNFNFK